MHGANMKKDRVQSKQVRVMKFCTIVYIVQYLHCFGLVQDFCTVVYIVQYLHYFGLVQDFCTIVYIVQYLHYFGLVQDNKSIKRQGVGN
jgi:hypothetical protein